MICKNIYVYHMCSKIDPNVQCRHLDLRASLWDYTWSICRLCVPGWTKCHYRRQGEKGIEKNTEVYLFFRFLRCSTHWSNANCCQRTHVSPWKHWLLHLRHDKMSNWQVPKQPKITYWNYRGASSLGFGLISLPISPEMIVILYGKFFFLLRSISFQYRIQVGCLMDEIGTNFLSDNIFKTIADVL